MWLKVLHELVGHDATNAAVLTFLGVVYLQWAGSRERQRTRAALARMDEEQTTIPRMIEDLRVFQIANHALGDEVERLTVENARLRGERAAADEKADLQTRYIVRLEAMTDRLTAEDDRPKGERDHEDIRDTTAER